MTQTQIKTTLPTRQALAAARYCAIEKQAPYFADSLFNLVPTEVADGTLSPKGTFAVTAQGVMLYEPAALARWTTPEAGAVMIHEVMHWLRDHAGRRPVDADPELWNIAGDLEINDDLAAMRLPLPDGGGLQPHDFELPEGKTAEWYYAALVEQQKKAKQEAGEEASGEGQDGKGEGQGGEAPGQGAGTPGKGAGGRLEHRCGGCAGNPYDCEPKDDPRGRSKAEIEVIKQATALAINAHAQSKGIGSVPAGMRRWAEESTKPPKVSWQQKLSMLGRARAAFRPGSVDYTFNRISRRQGGLGFGVGKPIAPALISRTPEVAIAVDTSGSMGQSEVERAIIEATSIMRAAGAAVHLIACDCRVHTSSKVRTPAQLLEGMKGGGGTDFRPVFEQIEKVHPKPDVMIFITDGGGWAPETPPKGTKVIWLLVGAHKMKPLRPTGGTYESITWGDFVEVDE